MVIHYDINDIRPYISWVYFFHGWSMNGKDSAERDRLRADAEAMLDSWQGRYHTHGVFELFDANGDGDDIVLTDGRRLPMLRQQRPLERLSEHPKPSVCLADFLRPKSSGIPDRLGVFATTIDGDIEREYDDDVYRHMLALTLAERLAEATAEYMHKDIRRQYWGYAKDEQVSIDDMLNAHYQGIRPAVGYPSIPDMSINFLLNDLIDMSRIGIRLTESGMMHPKASVSGLIFAHPKAYYFGIGKIGEDQLRDYARRRGLPLTLMRRFLQTSLANG